MVRKNMRHSWNRKENDRKRHSKRIFDDDFDPKYSNQDKDKKHQNSLARPNKKNLILCPQAGKPKIQYASQAEAERALEYYRLEEEKNPDGTPRKGFPIRWYYCNDCIAFHLSSRAELTTEEKEALRARTYVKSHFEKKDKSHLLPHTRHTSACWKSKYSRCYLRVRSEIEKKQTEGVITSAILKEYQMTTSELDFCLTADLKKLDEERREYNQRRQERYNNRKKNKEEQ